jgi:hypothetical protein
MIDLSGINFSGAESTLLVANTPMFIIRKLRADSAVITLARTFEADALAETLRERLTTPPQTPRDRAIPYALMVALSLKNKRAMIKDLLPNLGEHYPWLRAVGESLFSSLSPVTTNELVASNNFNVWKGVTAPSSLGRTTAQAFPT